MEQIPTKKIRNNKVIFIFAICLLLYCVFMILSYRLGFDHLVIVGAFREFFDLQAFALIALFLVLSVISFMKQKFKFFSYPFYSVIVLLAAIISLFLFV